MPVFYIHTSCLFDNSYSKFSRNEHSLHLIIPIDIYIYMYIFIPVVCSLIPSLLAKFELCPHAKIEKHLDIKLVDLY